MRPPADALSRHGERFGRVAEVPDPPRSGAQNCSANDGDPRIKRITYCVNRRKALHSPAFAIHGPSAFFHMTPGTSLAIRDGKDADG